jgi:hypothetical protein
MDACCPISTFGGGSGPFVLAIIFTRRKVYQNSHSDVESPPLHKSQISLGQLSSVGKRSWFGVAERLEDAFDEAESWHTVASALPSLLQYCTVKVGAFRAFEARGRYVEPLTTHDPKHSNLLNSQATPSIS